MQIFDAFVVSSFRADFANAHKLLPGDWNRVLETSGIPKLKDGHVKANMSRVEAIVGRNPLEKTTELKYIIHDVMMW